MNTTKTLNCEAMVDKVDWILTTKSRVASLSAEDTTVIDDAGNLMLTIQDCEDPLLLPDPLPLEACYTWRPAITVSQFVAVRTQDVARMSELVRTVQTCITEHLAELNPTVCVNVKRDVLLRKWQRIAGEWIQDQEPLARMEDMQVPVTILVEQLDYRTELGVGGSPIYFLELFTADELADIWAAGQTEAVNSQC